MKKYLVFDTIGKYTLLIRLDNEGKPIKDAPVLAVLNYNPDTEDWVQGESFPSIMAATVFMIKEKWRNTWNYNF